MPDLLKFALDCERFGAQGITVHPRPDERHIRYSDLKPLRENVATELNIEGYPSEEFVNLVLQIKPHQVTLVPDAPDAITLTQALLDRARPWLPDPPWTVRAHPRVVGAVAALLGTEVVPDDGLSPGAIIEGADGRVRVDATLVGWLAPQRRRLRPTI